MREPFAEAYTRLVGGVQRGSKGGCVRRRRNGEGDGIDIGDVETEHDDVKGKGSLYLVFLCIKANSTSWNGIEMFVGVISCETQSESRRYYTSSLHPHFNNVTLP